MKIIVLGAGLVGGPMAFDLAKENHLAISVADINPQVLKKFEMFPHIQTRRCDFSDPKQIKDLVRNHDLVLSAVPGKLGFQILQAVIAAKRNIVDISFFPEDPFELDELAVKQNVTAWVDCGVAPGLSNLLVGHVDQILDQTESVAIYVGGLPEIREWPFEYKAVFSPSDVIEEYLRPARLVANGQLVIRPALSDRESLNFPGIGTLEAFNTDGLRTLLKTIAAPDMKEKTLRYPGHAAKMAMLRETGFFSHDEMEINGHRIRPLDVTARLLFPRWKLEEGDRDLTVMKIIITGIKENRRWRYTHDLLDRYDDSTQIHSMARTTGYTATALVRMAVAGLYTRKGVTPLELVGRDPACTAFVLADLSRRKVTCRETVETIP